MKEFNKFIFLIAFSICSFSGLSACDYHLEDIFARSEFSIYFNETKHNFKHFYNLL